MSAENNPEKKAQWIAEAKKLAIGKYGLLEMPGLDEYVESLYESYFVEEELSPEEAFDEEVYCCQ